MTITRRDPEHIYADETGRVLPGVTSILGSVPPWLHRYDDVPADVLDYKRQVGSAVHHATALDDQGVLDMDTVDDALVSYLEAWRRYRAETGFVPDVVEQLVHHPSLGYCGTLDRIGHTRHLVTLLDVKTADPSTGLDAGPQTAAYLEAYRACTPNHGLPARVQRCSVHLSDDGRYRVVPHTNRRDFDVFKAALELWNFSSPKRRTSRG